eukprot:10650236-Ditylum_brightwellii.AAC.1
MAGSGSRKGEFSTCHCNHCQQKQALFGSGSSEPWMLQMLTEAAVIHCSNDADCAAHGLKTAPVGHKRVRSKPIFSILMHLWVSPGKEKRKAESEQYITQNSAAYKINRDLSDAGVERAVYFGKALIGPHICQLLSRQEAITLSLQRSLFE